MTQPFQIEEAMIRYSEGQLDHDGIFTLFQYLVDSGMVWLMSEHFRNTARDLILAGEIDCSLPKTKLENFS